MTTSRPNHMDLWTLYHVLESLNSYTRITREQHHGHLYMFVPNLTALPPPSLHDSEILNMDGSFVIG